MSRCPVVGIGGRTGSSRRRSTSSVGLKDVLGLMGLRIPKCLGIKAFRCGAVGPVKAAKLHWQGNTATCLNGEL